MPHTEIRPDLEQPDVFNDLDFDPFADVGALVSFINDARNVRKIREAVSKLNVGRNIKRLN